MYQLKKNSIYFTNFRSAISAQWTDPSWLSFEKSISKDNVYFYTVDLISALKTTQLIWGQLSQPVQRLIGIKDLYKLEKGTQEGIIPCFFWQVTSKVLQPPPKEPWKELPPRSHPLCKEEQQLWSWLTKG